MSRKPKTLVLHVFGLLAACGCGGFGAHPPNKLAFSVQPTGAFAWMAMKPLSVAVQDDFGNTVSSASMNITVAIGTNAGNGTLSGTTTVAAVGGVATFSDLSLDKSGAGYTLTASANGSTVATSSPFDVAQDGLVFTAQPTDTPNGQTISPVAVTVQAAAGSIVSSANMNVTVAIGTNPNGATLSGATTVAAVGGVATFSNLSLDRPGSGYTLTATANGALPATSHSFNIPWAPAPCLSYPPTVSFGPQTIGTTSPPESLTVTNCGTTGGLNFGIWGFQYSEFSETDNCPSILDAGASCTIEVVFSPRGPGPRGGGLDFNDNDYALLDFVATGPACSGLSLFCAPIGVVAVSVAIAPDPTGTFGRFAYATNANSNTVSMFGINADGTLTALVPAKVATGTNPTSMVIDPSGKFAYVANAGSNDVSMYAVGADGILASLGSPMAAGTLPISVAIAPDSTGKFGKFVYVANDSSNNVSMFSINADGMLTPAGTVGVGDSPVSVAVHPSGKFAYVLCNSSCQGGRCYDNTSVYVFNINSTTGALTLAETNVAGTNVPTSMAVDPSGNFAAVTNQESSPIFLYSINSTTGALLGAGAAFGAGHYFASLVLAIHPSGTLLAYVTNFPNDVLTYGYDIATGAYSLHGTVAAGSSPTSIAIDPSGKFAYVGNSGSLNVSMYSINVDGTLTPLVPATVGL